MRDEELPTLVLRGLESDARAPTLDATQRFLQAHLSLILGLWWVAWVAIALLLLARVLVLPAIERLRGGPRPEALPAATPSARP